MRLALNSHDKSKRLLPLIASIFVMLVTMLTSCEKFTLDEASRDGSKGNGNVVINVQKVQGARLSSSSSRADASTFTLGDICSRLSLVIFDGEEKIETINQVSDDNNFGTARINLDEGEYRLVAIAHNGKGNCTMSLPEKVKFTNNKLTDTFYYYGRLSVTDDGAQANIALERGVGAMKLHINDESLPAEVRSIKFYYTGGSSTLDATTGFGCVNSRQTENFNIEEGNRDFTIYTFPHEDNRYIKMTISLLDADAKVVKSFEKADLKLKKNQIVSTNISLDGSGISGGGDGENNGGGIGITFDPTWGETENVDF